MVLNSRLLWLCVGWVLGCLFGLGCCVGLIGEILVMWISVFVVVVCE